MKLNIGGLRNMITDARNNRKDTLSRRVRVYYVNESMQVLEKEGMISKDGLTVDVSSLSGSITLGGYPLLRDRKNRKAIISFFNSSVAWSPLCTKHGQDYLTKEKVDEIVKSAMLSDVIGVDYTMILVAFVLGIGLAATVFSLLFVVVLLL